MARPLPQIGIAAIAIHEPPWTLRNDWFGDTLPSKFVRHTGIESRRVSVEDEVTMAVQAVENLVGETALRMNDCAGVVFTASSLLPDNVRQKYRSVSASETESLESAARQFSRRYRLDSARLAMVNWGCSGYAKAMAVACNKMLPSISLDRNQFILLVTVNRTSSILDFSCKQTAGLFGDFAQATLLARCDSDRYPVHFEVLQALAETRPADGVFFDFHDRENVPVPRCEGGRGSVPRRLVMSLNGMGIGDAAPRVMAYAADKALRAAQIDPADVKFVVPHQAGSGIVRLAAMQLDGVGVRGEVINGLTREVANISSSSVPYAIKHEWNRLDGIVVCPTAGVGDPGDATVTCGCVVLRATVRHRLASQNVAGSDYGVSARKAASASEARHRIDPGVLGLRCRGTDGQPRLDSPREFTPGAKAG